jgi:hypothetical protein
MNQADAHQRAVSALGGLESSYGAQMGTEAMKVTAFKAWNASTTGAATGEEGWKQRRELGSEMVRDGLMTSTDVAAAVKGNAKRADGNGASFGEMIQFFEAAARGTTATTPDGVALTDKAMLHRAISGSQPGAVMGGHKKAVISANEVMMDEIKDIAAKQGTNSHAFKQKLAEFAGRYDVMSQISPDSAKVFAGFVGDNGKWHDGVMSMQLSAADGSAATIQSLIEANRSEPDFVEMRREYGASSMASYNAAQSAAAQGMAGKPGMMPPPPGPTK